MCLARVHRPTAASLGAGGPTTAPDSGLVFIAGETENVMAYFVPELGMAPKWCVFTARASIVVVAAAALLCADL